MNNYIYIAVMAAVSYTIRVLPLTLIRKPIKNQFIQSFLMLRISNRGALLFSISYTLPKRSRGEDSPPPCFFDVRQ